MAAFGTCFFYAAAAFAAEAICDIRDYGAKPDGQTLATAAIQKAIDECSGRGGGTVYLPPGTWLSGTIFLKSHVTLRLDAGCVLLGSPKPEDYPEKLPAVRSYTDNYVRQALLVGEDLDGVTLCGRGTIDGQGGKFHWSEYKNRPYLIRLVNCRDVTVEGLRLRNSAMWMQHYLACQRVRIRGLAVENHSTWNNDGLDLDSCRDAVVSDCIIHSDDDALCLKSTCERPCEDVTVSNCVLSSLCNAIKMGTESNGGFKNISISNCSISAPRESAFAPGNRRGLAGVALEIVDGGQLDRVSISNLTIDGVRTPLFLRLGNRARPFRSDGPKPGVGSFRNVLISNVVATGASNVTCSITGIPGHCVENVALSNISLGVEGGGSREQADKAVPEKDEGYPECTMFGALPAYGFYCRHVKGIRLSDVRVETSKPDLRPAVLCDDVDDLSIDGLRTRPAPGAAAVVRFEQTRGALVRGCRPETPVDAFLELRGNATRGIALMGNDLRQAAKSSVQGSDVPAGAISEVSNLGRETRSAAGSR